MSTEFMTAETAEPQAGGDVALSNPAEYAPLSKRRGRPKGKQSLPNLVRRMTLLRELLDNSGLAGARTRDIIAKRIGYGTDAQTLQQIGSEYGLTREGARQIITKCFKTLRDGLDWSNRLSEILKGLLAGRLEPLWLDDLPSKNLWLSDINEAPDCLAIVLDELLRGSFSVLSLDSRRCVSRISQAEYDKALRQMRSILRETASKRLETDVVKETALGQIENLPPELRETAWATVSGGAMITNGKIAGIRKSLGAEIGIILEESASPVHLSELQKMVKYRFGRDVSEGQVLMAAQKSGILLGRGTYGTQKHLSIQSEEDCAKVCKICERAIKSGDPERQWHAAELAEIVRQDAPDIAEKVDQYCVNALLSKFSEEGGAVSYLGRFVWLNKKAASKVRDRVTIAEAIRTILKEAGRPMRSSEIKEKFTDHRGINRESFFQIHPDDHVAHLGGGFWGLRDWQASAKAVG